MDRNIRCHLLNIPAGKVALRKESVDRNASYGCCLSNTFGSLSARRAWIEITRSPTAQRTKRVALRKESVDRNGYYYGWFRPKIAVALRKESVDRNYIIKITGITPTASLSARRAWIEIVMQEIAQQRKQVALRKESVDRNRNSQYSYFLFYGRSPQGERG